MRIPIRVVFYRDEDSWIAHCLEFDLLGDGTTREVALSNLSEAIHIQVEASRDFENPSNLFAPADGKYFQMFAAGDDVAELQLSVEPHGEISVEPIELREFAEAASS